MKSGGEGKHGSPNSGRAGQTEAATGVRANVYVAPGELMCSTGRNIIREGELFIKEAGHTLGSPPARRFRQVRIVERFFSVAA